MNYKKQESKIFKDGLKKSNNKIIIGGIPKDELPTKASLVGDYLLNAEREAREQASQILEEAEVYADKIKKEAEAQIESIRQTAHTEGLRLGREEGIKLINEEIAFVLQEASKLLESIKKERDEIFRDEENRVYEIISQIAKKLIYRDLSYEVASVKQFILESISKLDQRQEINILINPKTAAKLNQIKTEILESSPGLESLNISGDINLKVGELIIESPKERLDLRLDSITDELLQILKS
jgi:flagellar assembly protein FliH